MRLSSGVRCDMSGWGSSAITMAVYARARGMRRGYDAGVWQAGAPPTTPTSTGRCRRNTDGAYAPSAFLLYDERRRRPGRYTTLYDYYEARLSSWGSHPTPVDRTTAPRRGNANAPELRCRRRRRRRRRDCTTVVVERCTRGSRQSRRDTTSVVVVDDFGMASSVLRDNDRRWTSLDSIARLIRRDVWRDTGLLPCRWCWCCGILQ